MSKIGNYKLQIDFALPCYRKTQDLFQAALFREIHCITLDLAG